MSPPGPWQLLVSGAVALLAAGCAVGPDYHRPETQVPSAYRFAADSAPDSFADRGWWEIYQDPVLLDLLKEALANNLDVRIAAARVDAARANLGAAHMQQLPQVAIGASAQRARTSQLSATV